MFTIDTHHRPTWLMGSGIDVQAVFGDPIATDESLPSPAGDVD